MKTEKDAWFELDDIRFRLRCGVCALSAIHDAMESGSNAADYYIDGLYCVQDYLDNLTGELDKNVDALFPGRNDAEEAVTT